MTTEGSKSMTSLGGIPEETLHLAYAEASVMVLECLMQILVERKLVPLDELLNALDTAIETKRNLVQDGDHAEIAAIAVGVLSRIGNSLAATSPAPNAASVTIDRR